MLLVSRSQVLKATRLVLFPLLISVLSHAEGPRAKLDLSWMAFAKYVGSAACSACHATHKSFATNPHWKTTLDERRGPAFQGCEGCHGPGSLHVTTGGDNTKIFTFRVETAAQISKRCLTCHQSGEEHANFLRSAHKESRVSCVDCHSGHRAEQPQFLLRTQQPQLCYRCHADAKADMAKPFHHRVNEGLIKCTDCHNQHGAFLPRLLRTASSQEQVCSKCHTEQTGPFTFEHAPLKTEGCTACHEPHGSSNNRLLKRNQLNSLCLECHTFTTGTAVKGTEPFHNVAERYQACTLCHSAIHGSNVSRTFQR